MFFMIFVNDLWSLTGVPKWLEHTSAADDGMGFSDLIFPLFLFIVGLSIPLAINIRIKRLESHAIIFGHIISRTIALLVMGFFMVNYESINQDAMGLNRFVWQILMATGIVLIWMDYKRLPGLGPRMAWGLKIAGVLLLGFLALIYKGGSMEDIVWMKPHWWGILGLIGWAYLLNSLLFLFLRKRWLYLIPVFVFLLFMNVQEKNYFESLPSFRIVVSASNHVLVMAGMLCTLIYLRFKEKGKSINHFLVLVFFLGIIFISYGFLVRPAFPISKIFASPSWTAICTGVALLTYAFVYLLVDRGGYYKWANPIRPAGTSTLTCYLMPYFLYPVWALIGLNLPDFLSHGIVGLLKSLLFALIIVLFVGIMEKRNIRLRI